MWPMIDAVNRMKERSWSSQLTSLNPCPKLSGNQSTTPESTRARAASAEVKKKSFCPPLYLPTSASAVSLFVEERIRPSQAQSLLLSHIWPAQCRNITTDEAKKKIPTQGWSQRQTWRPPKRKAIQPKIGVQIGRPVSRQIPIETATLQWITRESIEW